MLSRTTLTPSRFAVYGPRVVPFYNYLQAAFVIAEDGWLSASGVVRVAAELVIDHRFDAEGLARSYVDLRRRGCVRGDLGAAIREATRSLGTDTRLPAIREVSAMCDRLDALMPAVSPAPRPEVARPDYGALVVQHNPRHKR